jgi:hypothetical protein
MLEIVCNEFTRLTAWPSVCGPLLIHALAWRSAVTIGPSAGCALIEEPEPARGCETWANSFGPSRRGYCVITTRSRG